MRLWERLKDCGPWSVRCREADLERELQAHLDLETEEARQQGLPPQDARYAAQRAFGNAALVREDVRATWGFSWLVQFAQDLRYGLRQMQRSAGFTAVAVLSLALGIGANTAIFSVIDALMLKTLPVREPERLVQLFHQQSDNSFTYAVWEQVRNRQDVFSGVFAYSGTSFDLASGGEKHMVPGLYVSGDYFFTLGVAPFLGRLITDKEDQRGSASVAVLNYEFWQQEYGGDPAIIGRTIRLDNHPFEVIGVAPPGFFGTDVGETFSAAVPLASEALFDATAPAIDERQSWWLNIVGRLKDGVDSQSATARLKVLSPAVFESAQPQKMTPEFRHDFLSDSVDPKPAATGNSDVRQRYGRSLLLLQMMVGVVLLAACANVANLLLARASARQHEIAARLALGASPGRLVRQLLTESLTLSLLGGVLGVALARWGGRALFALISTGRRQFLDLSFDLRVFGFTAAIALLTAALFGFAPALRASQLAPYAALKAHGVTGRRRRFAMGRVLVIAQVALSILLLVGAGLFVRTLRGLLTQNMGFRPHGVLLISPDFRGAEYASEREAMVADELLNRMRSLPGVASAGRAAVTPIGGRSINSRVRVDVTGGGEKSVTVSRNVISPDYLRTVGTALLAGRDFNANDTKTSAKVAIVNQTAARQLFGELHPIGRTYRDTAGLLHLFGETDAEKEFLVEVVGVAEDAKYRRLREPVPPTIYVPIAQNSAPARWDVAYALRFSGASTGIIAGVKRIAHAVDPRISLTFRLLSTQVNNSLVQERLMAKLASVFGLLALVLAAVGIYGLMSYTTTRRTNEIGIRMALGAARGHILTMVLSESLLLVTAGVVFGVATAMASGRLVRGMLYGISAADPITFFVTAALMAATAAAAAFLPARRASRLDPMVALRYE